MNGIDSWIMGGVAGILGILGLFVASGAKDGGMYLFGLLLFLFALLFIFACIKGAFDAAETESPSAETQAT